jgi:hypothetical protein
MKDNSSGIEYLRLYHKKSVQAIIVQNKYLTATFNFFIICAYMLTSMYSYHKHWLSVFWGRKKENTNGKEMYVL